MIDSDWMIAKTYLWRALFSEMSFLLEAAASKLCKRGLLAAEERSPLLVESLL